MSTKKASPAVTASNKSNSKKQNPKFDDIFATVKAEQEFDKLNRSLYEERIQIWKNYSNRIEPLRRAWFETWRNAANNLSDVNAVADSLLLCVGIIEKLDNETGSWHRQASEWMERVKNNNLGNQYQLLYPWNNSSWGEYSLMLWAEGIIKGNGLKTIICNLYTNTQASTSQDEKNGLAVLRLISQGASRDELIQFLKLANCADALCGVTAALAMMVISPEDHYTFEPFELPQTVYILEKARNLIAITFAQYDSRIGKRIAEQYFPLPIPETVQPAQKPCSLPMTVNDTVEGKPELQASNADCRSDQFGDVVEVKRSVEVTIETYAIKNPNVYKGKISYSEVARIVNAIKSIGRPCKVNELQKSLGRSSRSLSNNLGLMKNMQDLEDGGKKGVYWLFGVPKPKLTTDRMS